MGNALAATAPSQIQSVENYLADVPKYKFDKSLGSTRFMKVARAEFAAGFAVIKVFALPDSTVDLESYKSEVKFVGSKLKLASNCLPYEETHISDKAAFLIRQYVKHNLYDRISTRPFYNKIEKKWVAFQLLCALNQMAKFKILHGDIKSENVLVTSWNWLLISDFATYKPTYLPEDNPADFNYFFDTSRRRTCYIAPERFTDNPGMLTRSQLQKLDGDGAAMHAMDIFSAGCVIAEIFTDGSPMFDLSQLLAFRQNPVPPDSYFERIEDESIRSLVMHMTQADPASRSTAEQYLTQWKDKAFPEHFYTYLKHYLGRFCEPPLMSADQIISTLHSDAEKILFNLVRKANAAEALVIISSLLLSCIRQAKYCNSRLKAMSLIVEFAKHLGSDVILERFVPYLTELLRNDVTRVRAQAVRSLATCLTFVSEIPRDEANIFSEYILPGITTCAQDTAVPVRQSFAESIAVFAECAFRFLDYPQLTQQSTYISALASDQTNYDTQLQLLRDATQNQVQVLLSDNDSTVRQSVLEFSISRLCTFFGKQKANDVLLIHMITILNDKKNWQLRAMFFKSLISVAGYIGFQSSYFLKPLLQQGLSDCQEFVVSQTLATIAKLVEQGLLPKQTVAELIRENVVFVVHPCQWIRENAVSFLSSCARRFDSVDTLCYLTPTILPLVKYPVVQTDKEQTLLSALQPAVNHAVLNAIINYPNTKHVLDMIKTHQTSRSRHESGNAAVGDSEDEEAKTVLKKLMRKGMSDHDENMLLRMQDIISRQQKQSSNGTSGTASDWQSEGCSDGSVINILNFGPSFVKRHAELVKDAETGINVAKVLQKKSNTKKKSDQPHDMNEEWKTMFGKDAAKPRTNSVQATSSKKATAADMTITMSQLESAAAAPLSPPALENRQSNVQYKFASCKLNLRALVHRRRDLHKLDVAQRELEESADAGRTLPAFGSQPKGLLVAHMLEHRGPVYQVAVSPSHKHFVTVSSDKSVRLWETLKFEGKSVVNRSKASLQKFSGALRSAAFCDDDLLICSSDDGFIHALSVERMCDKLHKNNDSAVSPGPAVQFSHAVSQHTYGRITGLKSIVNSHVVVFSTAFGSVVALDVRVRNPVWELKQDLAHGLPTGFCIDPRQHWLCVGSVRGVHTCWDLRFRLPVTSFAHPSSASVRKLSPHPMEPSCVISVATGNNEVSVWDMATGTRQLTLWASTAPALSLTQKTSDSVNGLHMAINSGQLQVFTGGSDGKVRLWDIANVQNSRVVCGPGLSSSHSMFSVSYETRLVDGTRVIQEQLAKTKRDSGEAVSQPTSAQPSGSDHKFRSGEQHAVPVHHHDIITDIAMVHLHQTFLVSASRDGVVKVWK